MESTRVLRARLAGFVFSLAPILALFFSAPQVNAQKPKPGPQNPPALPASARSSQPVAAGVHAEIFRAKPSAGVNSASWTAFGPAALQSDGGVVSGRVTGIAVDPTDPNTIYVASAGGGVWKTTNGGTSWAPLTDNQPTLAMGSIAVAPSNHLRIYAGMGEANNSLDSMYGNGILVSSDGGASWSRATANGAFVGNVVAQIAVDPTNADTAYAAVGGYGQNGIFDVNTGIWKTTDAGVTWTNVTAAASLTSTQPWSAVVVDPNTPSIVYAAVGELSDGGSVNGVFRSSDSGATWQKLVNAPDGAVDTLIGRTVLAVAPNANQAGKHVLYVASADVNSSGLHYFGRSDNADAATPTFTDLTAGTPNFLGGQGWYDIVVNVDAAGVVYASGVEDYNNGGADLILKSTNLGAAWTDISVINSFEPHTDSHAIGFDSSNRMLLGSDGGVYRYDPANPGWTVLNGNLNTIQLQGIGLHPTTLASVVGGSQDNGTELFSDDLLWNEVDGGDGGPAQFSQTDPTHCYTIHPVASFGPTDFFRRSDGGCAAGTWVSKTTGILGNTANFYPPFLVDPTNGSHLLMGTDYVEETTNSADSWSAIGTPGVHGFNGKDLPVDSVALSPKNGTNPQVVYAAVGGSFATSSQVFVTKDDGATWTEVDPPACTQKLNLGVGCRINQILTDPNDATGNTAVAVTSNFTAGGGHVLQTTNMGATWTDITGNLPNLPTWSAVIDTDPSHTMYVSTDAGVYMAQSPYTTWKLFGTGLPNAQGVDLELNRSLNALAVATHGRGAWEILTAPHVTSVTTTAADGGYVAGATIPITVNFSAAVTVTGTPQLTVNTTPNGVATYTAGSGTSALTFTYTVAAGQVTDGNATGGKLDYGSTSALALNGGTIQDGNAVAAVLTLYAPGAAGSLSAGHALLVESNDTPKVTVTPGATTVSTVGSLSVTVTVSDEPGDPTPSGSVVLSGGNFTSAAAVLNAGSAVVSVPGSLLSPGPVTLSASYTPDATSSSIYKPATGTATAAVTITKGTPTVTVAPGANSVSKVQSLSVTVTVSSGTGNTVPGGSVVLSGGGFTSAATTLTAGSATITVPGAQLSGSQVTFSAAYTPDNGSASLYTTANGSASGAVTVGVGTPTVAVSPSSSAITTVQPLSVTVTVSGGNGDPTPTGSVILSGGGYTSAATPLTAGSATINIAAGVLAVGSDTLTATYTPDTTSATVYSSASGSTTAPVVVSKPAPTVTVSPASSSITTLQALSVAVTVSGGNGNPTPTGSVVLSSGSYASAATALTAGAATINIPAETLPAGNNTLTATYTPDTAGAAIYNGASGSASNPVVVSKAAPSVTVSPAASSITTLQGLTVAVTVSGGNGNPTPTGSVVVSSGTYASAATAVTAGAATINIPAQSLPVGNDTLSATYTPDTAGGAIYSGGTGAAATPVAVSKVTPSVVVASSANPVQAGQSVTFTATVSSSAPGAAPTGSVNFLDGTTQLGSGSITAGVATYSTSALAEGAHQITAQYTGDAVFSNATSAALAQTVSSLSIGPSQGTSTTITTGSGGVVDFPLMVTPPAATPVTITATGLPSEFTVSITPPTVAAGAGATKVDVVIHVGQATSSAATPVRPGSRVFPVALGLILLPLLGLGRSVRRARRFLLVLMLSIAGIGAAIGLSGCSHTPSSTTNKVAAGTYTLTVTATAGSDSKSTVLTINVTD